MFFSFSLKVMSGHNCGVSFVKYILTEDMLSFEKSIISERDTYACEIQIILVLRILTSLNLYTLNKPSSNIGKLAMR